MIKRYNKDKIEILSEILVNDGVISVPTDTVFGICASINSKKGYRKLIEIKNRDIKKSFPVMCANKEQIKQIAIVDEKSEKLINSFMPGPITLILKRKDNLEDYVTNGKDTIAIRIATSKELEKLIIKTGAPLFMTSANISGKRECSSLEQIQDVFPHLDGMMEGNITFSKSSTIVDCTLDEVRVLREGPISIKQINEII